MGPGRKFWERASEAADALTPILFVLAIGLGVLDLTMLLAQAAQHLPAPRVYVNPDKTNQALP